MRPILIHGLPEALIAAEASITVQQPVFVQSAPAAASHGGPGWFLGLISAALEAHPAAHLTGLLDCAADPGAAMAALRAGCRHIIFTGAPDIAEKLNSMAGPGGAQIITERPAALSLRGRRDALPYALNWLQSTA